jgi:carboxyl-terminal processing protease
VKIDTKFTKGLNINDAVKLMRGEKGTRVTLTIQRDTNGKPLVFPLVRNIINIKSMRFKTITSGYGYIRIAQFQSRTGEEFRTALVKLHEQNGGQLKGLVIDLRNNPGGLVDQAAKVADCFIGDGLENGLIVYTQGRTKESRQNLSAYVATKEPHYPIVILMNGGSASASEILAGALQDHKRAIVMGTQSFGKGSVQSIFPMKGGAGLKLTTARYYTPNGRSIQVKGITPDILVTQLRQENHTSARRVEGEFREAQLDRHLSGGGMHPPLKQKPASLPTTPPVDPELVRDYQLSRAVGLLQGLSSFAELRKQPTTSAPAGE